MRQFKQVRSWEKFVKHTGLLETEEQIKAVVPKALLKRLDKSLASEEPYGWDACSETLTLLNEVCKKNPNLYIATQVENDSGSGVCYENEIRFVNRNVYYLCTKNKDLPIYFND